MEWVGFDDTPCMISSLEITNAPDLTHVANFSPEIINEFSAVEEGGEAENQAIQVCRAFS